MDHLYDEKKWELFSIAGDEDQFDPDRHPHGILSPEQGIKKDRIAEVPVRYKDRVLFIDVYKFGDELALHLMCPRCLNYLWCSSAKKQMEFDPKTGKLSVEPFGCVWEEGRGTDGTKADRMDFGVGLCRWQVGIKGNIALDA